MDFRKKEQTRSNISVDEAARLKRVMELRRKAVARHVTEAAGVLAPELGLPVAGENLQRALTDLAIEDSNFDEISAKGRNPVEALVQIYRAQRENNGGKKN